MQLEPKTNMQLSARHLHRAFTSESSLRFGVTPSPLLPQIHPWPITSGPPSVPASSPRLFPPGSLPCPTRISSLSFSPPAENLFGMPSVLGYLPLNRKTAPMHCLAFKLSHASPPYPVFLPPLLFPRRPAVPNAPLPRPGTQPLGGGQDEYSYLGQLYRGIFKWSASSHGARWEYNDFDIFKCFTVFLYFASKRRRQRDTQRLPPDPSSVGRLVGS